MRDGAEAIEAAIQRHEQVKKKEYGINLRLTNGSTKIGLARSSLMKSTLQEDSFCPIVKKDPRNRRMLQSLDISAINELREPIIHEDYLKNYSSHADTPPGELQPE